MTIAARAFLAPMAGVTDLGMRRLAKTFGAGLAFSEMVADGNFSGNDEGFLRARGEGVSPHAVQIVGREPQKLAQTAQAVEDLGADLIDINMGCPSKRVVGGACGAALMRDLDLAAELIAATVRAVKIPVSVKMRLGWDESSRNAPELARRAEVEGAAMVTVHGRTRAQFYKGEADWDALRAVRHNIRVPLVANGDCRSVEDAVIMREKSGADAVMIGRAALGQPWLVGDIAFFLDKKHKRPAIGATLRRDAARIHLKTLVELMGPHQGLRHARKHLAAYAEVAAAAGFALPPAARRRLVESEDFAEALDLIDLLYRENTAAEAA